MFILAYKWNEIKNVWTNEADSMFAKAESLVEVPYVKPSFLESLDVKSMIPRSHGIWMNDIKDVMFNMWYNICNMLCALQNDKF